MQTRYRATPEYVTGMFTETEGKDITAATVQVGLSASSTTPPTTWVDPDDESRPTVSTARVSMLIGTGVQPGTYVLWVKVADSPETLVRPAKNELIRVI
jgi:hypothetical protein